MFRAPPKSRRTTGPSPTDSTWRLSAPQTQGFADGPGIEDAEDAEGWEEEEEWESGEEGAVGNEQIVGIAHGRTALQQLPYLSRFKEEEVPSNALPVSIIARRCGAYSPCSSSPTGTSPAAALMRAGSRRTSRVPRAPYVGTPAPVQQSQRASRQSATTSRHETSSPTPSLPGGAAYRNLASVRLRRWFATRQMESTWEA
eukprot:746828-Hanusia_phi.AAC.2